MEDLNLRDSANKSEEIYDGRIFTLFKNGNFDLIKMKHEAVAIIALSEDKKTICVVKEYRPALKVTKLAIPGGKIEAGENPLEAAYREFKEETGYDFVPNSAKILHSYNNAGGYSDEKIHMVELTFVNNGKSVQRLDDEERIIPVLLSIEEFSDYTFASASTIIAQYYISKNYRK